MSSIRVALVVLATTGLVAQAAAQFTAVESDKVKGSFFFQSFGTSVAVDGDVVVVGSPTENLSKGTVYVYRVVGGELVHEQTLTDPTPVSNDLFGLSVAVSGELIAVGSPGTGNGTFNDDGELYVYRFDGATWQVDFSVTGQPLGYGTTVDVDGDVVVTSYPDADAGVSNGGALLVYRHDGATWNPNGVLPGTLVNGFLGEVLALDGDWIFGGTIQGTVDVFHLGPGGWSATQTLALDAEALDADGARLVVGHTAGATLLRRSCDVWSEEAFLTDPIQPLSTFGRAVGVSGDAVLVGAWNVTTEFAQTGAAHVFRHDGAAWPLEQSLIPTDTHTGQMFGWSVGLGGDLLVVGARADDEVSANSGAAYLFEAAPQTPRWQDLGSGLAGDAAPELTGVCTLQAGEPLALQLACAGPGSSAALFVGFSALEAPFKGGVLVPNPDLLITGLGVDGQGELTLSGSWPGGVPSAFGFWFQQWVVDAGAPAGLAATNALLATTP